MVMCRDLGGGSKKERKKERKRMISMCLCAVAGSEGKCGFHASKGWFENVKKLGEPTQCEKSRSRWHKVPRAFQDDNS